MQITEALPLAIGLSAYNPLASETVSGILYTFQAFLQQ